MCPVHVTLKVAPDLPSLRKRRAFAALRRAFAGGRQGTVRMAKALNRVWSRRGKVFPEHYFEHILRTSREVKNAIGYLLGNAFKHRVLRSKRSKDTIHDPSASGTYLQGWKKGWRPTPPRGPTPVSESGTWLLSIGWKRHGLFPVLT